MAVARWVGRAIGLDGDVLVLPALFLRRVVPAVLWALDQLMPASEVRIGPQTPAPPLDPAYWLPDVGHEEQLGLLVGLDELSP